MQLRAAALVSDLAASRRAEMRPEDDAAIRGGRDRAAFGWLLVCGRLPREKLAAAMGAFHQPAIVLHGDSQMPAANGAGLVEIRDSRHDR